MASITLKQGDTISRTLTIKDSSGNVIDITGGTVKFRIVRNLDDAKADAIFADDDLTISDGAGGQATLSVANSASTLWPVGSFFWQVEYIDDASDPGFSHNDYGICLITKSIYSNG